MTENERVGASIAAALSDVGELAAILTRWFPDAVGTPHGRLVVAAMADAYLAGMAKFLTRDERGYLEHVISNKLQAEADPEELGCGWPNAAAVGRSVLQKLRDMRGTDAL